MSPLLTIMAAAAPTAAPAGNPALAELKDIHLPAEIGLWPLAWGWWLLTALLILGLWWLTSSLLKRHRFWRVRRLALKALQTGTPSAADTNRVLKQVALHYFPRHQVASFEGRRWSEFLCRQQPALDAASLETLLQASYRPTADDTQNARLQQLAITWLKGLNHRRLRNAELALTTQPEGGH